MFIPLRACRFASALALVIAASPAWATVLFNEDFQTAIDPISGDPVLRCSGPDGAGTYPFPETWLLRNVDNRTPDPQVSYVNEAWEVREDFGSDITNCVAFSTSFYSPAGAADDWMWTPAIILPASGDLSLSWRARAYDPAYPDGYEVRVMAAPAVPTGGTGVIGNQITASTQVFSVPAEATTWTTHVVDLAPFVGQTIRVGFRNNTNDKFLLVVDDVRVFDASVDLTAVPVAGFAVAYPRVPSGISVDANLQVAAQNIGGLNLTNVSASAQLERDGVSFNAPLPANVVPALGGGATTPLTFGSPVALAGDGAWSVSYVVTSDQNGSESDPANNTLEQPLTVIGGTEWARHEGGASGVLGIGAGNGGEIGTSFTLTQTATFEGIRFDMSTSSDTDTWPGQSVVANLRATDATGKPTDLLATTEAITSSIVGGVYDVKFVGGPQTLAAGTYFASVVEPAGATSPAMPLTLSLQRFTTMTNWVNWPTSPYHDFAAIEEFGSGFERVPNVSLLSELSIFKDGFEQVGDPPPARAASSQSTTRKYGGVTALAKVHR